MSNPRTPVEKWIAARRAAAPSSPVAATTADKIAQMLADRLTIVSRSGLNSNAAGGSTTGNAGGSTAKTFFPWTRLPPEIKTMVQDYLPISTAVNLLLADVNMYWEWFKWNNRPAATLIVNSAHARMFLSNHFSYRTLGLMGIIAYYPNHSAAVYDPVTYRNPTAPLNLDDAGQQWIIDRSYGRLHSRMNILTDIFISQHPKLHSLATMNRLAPTYDVILEFLNDYVLKCLSAYPEEAHELPPRFAEPSLQLRGQRYPSPNTQAVNARYYRDWNGPTVLSLEHSERERLISAAWHFEYYAKVVRQVGHYDFPDLDDFVDVFLGGARTANLVKETLTTKASCCEDERTACIYHYVRGLYRQIFHSLTHQFLDQVEDRLQSIDTTPMENERRFSWYDMQFRWWNDPQLDRGNVPDVFLNQKTQDEYIDILCSFGLEFLHYVLRMSPADRQKMIVSTFYPRWTWFEDEITPETYLFRGLFERLSSHYREDPEVGEDAKVNRDDSLGDESSATFAENLAAVADNQAWRDYGMVAPPNPPPPAVPPNPPLNFATLVVPPPQPPPALPPSPPPWTGRKSHDFNHPSAFKALRKRGWVFWNSQTLIDLGLDTGEELMRLSDTNNSPADHWGEKGWLDDIERPLSMLKHNAIGPTVRHPLRIWRIVFEGWLTPSNRPDILQFPLGKTWRIASWPTPVETGRVYGL